MSDEKATNGARRLWIWIGTFLGGVASAVLIAFAIPIAQPYIEDLQSLLGPQLDVSVVNNSYCDFVAPSVRDGEVDSDAIGVRPADFPTYPCDEQIDSIQGGYTNLELELVVSPRRDETIVLTDVTIRIDSQEPTTGSAYYNPVGHGGSATTLTASVNVEEATGVEEVSVFDAGNEKIYSSLQEALPRVTATKSDPLVLVLSFKGKTKYTSFDIVLHSQSGDDSDTFVLDNEGDHFRVAGADGLVTFVSDGDGDDWAACC